MDASASTSIATSIAAPSAGNAKAMPPSPRTRMIVAASHPSSTGGSSNPGIHDATSAIPSTRDDVYNLAVAQRSVARAALHLGITSMSDEALQTLADVLLNYLQRVASTAAHLVEASGRASQHTNTLDMLHAVELCTAPAVGQSHFTSTGKGVPNTNVNADSTTGAIRDTNDDMENAATHDNTEEEHDGDGHSNTNNSSHHPPTSWQGLAQFCFGPQWQHDDQPKLLVSASHATDNNINNTEDAQLAALAATGGVGGKVAPLHSQEEAQAEAQKDQQKGWRAPYPDELTLFPTVLNPARVANPHTMDTTRVLQSLYSSPTTTTDGGDGAVRVPPSQDMATALAQQRAGRVMADALNELNDIPEPVFQQSWEDTTNNNNRNSRLIKQPYQKATTEGTATTKSTPMDVDQPEGSRSSGGAAAAPGGIKRKLDQDDEANKTASQEDPKSKSEETTNEAKQTASSAIAGGADADNGGSSPPKKKAKLEDGSAKPSTPKTKKKQDKKPAAAQPQQQHDKGNSATADPTNATTSSNDNLLMTPRQAHERTPPNYVPIFYPPIPLSATEAAARRTTTIVDAVIETTITTNSTTTTAATTTAATNQAAASTAATINPTTTFGLRSALVELGSTYWGSSWEATPVSSSGNSSGEAQSQVPAGRTQGVGGRTAVQVPAPIVPLGRASGSRVSRILEGSMDASSSAAN